MNKAIDLINEILKGSSPYTAYSTVQRIKKDKLNKTFRPYIIKLEQTIADYFKNFIRPPKA